jgi:hypothetical protein
VPIRDDAALATSVAFPGGDDGIDDWLGCESCHPLTWLPAASDRRF